MYVCVCHALTERDVRSAETSGAASSREVFGHFGVRPRCGRCVSSMRSMLTITEPAGERRHASDGQAPGASQRHHDR